MNKILTSTALISLLVAGTASAGSVSVQQSYLGGGTTIQSMVEYQNNHQITATGANLPSNSAQEGLYIGSK
jgi:acid phosphatase class B